MINILIPLLIGALLSVALCARPAFTGKKHFTSLQILGAFLGAALVFPNVEQLVMIGIGFSFTAGAIAIARIPALRRRRLVAANIGAGRHEHGVVAKLADAVISTRYLVLKAGSDVDHVNIAGANDVPLGIGEDSATNIGDPLAVALLGNRTGTLLAVAAGAIAAGVEVYTAANGQVSVLSGTTGTYYKVGLALTAASAAGDQIEILHTYPVAKAVA